MSREKKMAGKRFGRLIVIEKGTWVTGTPIRWICKCDCGMVKEINGASLRSGSIVSCGCLKNEKAKERMTKHGMSQTLLYNIWTSMKGRCGRPSCKDYPRYGGRGIKVCEEWRDDFVCFYNWAVGNGYKKHLTIERINIDEDYKPNNCKWIPNEEQALNTRRTVKIEHDGSTYTLREFALRHDINYNTLRGCIQKGENANQIIERLGKR